MQERESCTTYSAALGSFCLGALGGAVLGLLLAPRSGRETRERMGGRLRQTADSAQEMKQRLLRKGERALQEASRKTREAADALTSRIKRATPPNDGPALGG
jgi:gas vesicle protein